MRSYKPKPKNKIFTFKRLHPDHYRFAQNLKKVQNYIQNQDHSLILIQLISQLFFSIMLFRCVILSLSSQIIHIPYI